MHCRIRPNFSAITSRLQPKSDAEAKGRRRDLLISEDDLYARYAALVPKKVCRVSDLREWLKRAHQEVRQTLFFAEADLLRSDDVNPRKPISQESWK